MSSTKSKNLGHRGGCELQVINPPADNSIECLKIVKENESNLNLAYLEFDIWEIKENGLLVIHGGNVPFRGRGHAFTGENSSMRLLDNQSTCKIIFGKDCGKYTKITEFNEEQAQNLVLADKQNPPSLSKYVNEIISLSLEIQIRVDIKNIETDEAVRVLFQELSKLKTQVQKNDLSKSLSDQWLSIWAKRKKRYPSDRKIICEMSEKHNIGVYVKSQLMCKNE